MTRRQARSKTSGRRLIAADSHAGPTADGCSASVRDHQGPDKALTESRAEPSEHEWPGERRGRLGGLLSFYHRDAA
jgi:hypothetical protein